MKTQNRTEAPIRAITLRQSIYARRREYTLCAAARIHPIDFQLRDRGTPHHFGRFVPHGPVKAGSESADTRPCRRREVRYAIQAGLEQTLRHRRPIHPNRFLHKSTI